MQLLHFETCPFSNDFCKTRAYFNDQIYPFLEIGIQLNVSHILLADVK